jgi:BlaI family transcriptional regulator, penicillinase repressor
MAMARTARDVTEAELAVMRVLWDDGPGSVRQISATLAVRDNPMQPATVQKLLERLEEKGCVERDRSGAVQLFAATAAREEIIDRRIRGIVDDLCEGSMTPLLSHLVKDGLSARDLRQLRSLIERLDTENGGKKA